MQKHRNRRPPVDKNHRLPTDVIFAIENLLSLLDADGSVKDSYLREEYLSKFLNEAQTPAKVRRTAAIEKFLSVDKSNHDSNSRIHETDGGFNILPRVTWSRFIRACRTDIASVLGPLNDDIVLGGFSGGASTSRRRTESRKDRKFEAKADITESAECVMPVLYRLAPLLRQYGIFESLRRVRGAVLFTVPKKSDIDRCACKEPDLNMYLQKGVGLHIQRRLLRKGIDLRDQSRNRLLAREGSITGETATLDLSSASDTVCIELVRAMLPDDWFRYLDSIRSHEVSIDGEYYTTAMFSSMGNGFTFQLESLLFWAVTKTVCRMTGTPGIVSVYGDDIICPTEAFGLVTWVLGYLGFKPNEAKSFATGSFRESCGGHYNAGFDVTPFYLKRRPDRLTDLIRVANQFRRWLGADAVSGVINATEDQYELWCLLRDYVPREFWGGCDLSSDTQLVSPHVPSKRLVRMTKEYTRRELGAYVDWHNSNWNRGTAPRGEDSPEAATSNRCRSRPAKPGVFGMNRNLFLSEIPTLPKFGV